MGEVVHTSRIKIVREKGRRCPAAQSVIGCIQIQDNLLMQEMEA